MNKFKACMLTALTALMAQNAVAGAWIKAESQHFIVYSDADAQTTRQYVDKLESFNTIVSATYAEMQSPRFPTRTKTRAYFMETVDEFYNVRPELGYGRFWPLWSCEDGDEMFSTTEVENNNSADGIMGHKMKRDLNLDLGILFSAYNKSLLEHNFGRLPRWVVEGLDNYVMTAVIGDGTAQFGSPAPHIGEIYTDGGFIDATSADHYIPFRDLIADKPLDRKGGDAFELESWVMVHHLMTDKVRREKFGQYLRLVSNGTPSNKAYDQTIGIPDEEFARTLKGYFNVGVPITTYPYSEQQAIATNLTTLPHYHQEIPLLEAATRTCPGTDQNKNLLKWLQKAVVETPNDELTQQALARAEIRSDTPETAKTWLTAAIERDSDNFDDLFMLGRMYLAIAERDTGTDRTDAYTHARLYLDRAASLDPSSPPALYYLARAHADLPDYPDKDTLNNVVLSESYSHQHPLYEAELFIRTGDYSAAEAPVEYLLNWANKDEKLKIDLLTKIRAAIQSHQPLETILPMMTEYQKLARK